MSLKAGPLILGSTGCVGRALAQIWPADRPAIWQHRPGKTAPRKTALEWDILAAPPPPLRHPVSGILLLAGGTSDEALRSAVPLAEAACDVGEREGVPVLLASSQAVYGLQSGPLTEDAPCAPTNPYGLSKLAMERATGGRATALRIGNVVGCDALAHSANRGALRLDRFDDGASPRRSYLSAVGLKDIVLALLDHPDALPTALNVADVGTLEMADLLAAAGVSWTWQPAPPTAIREFALDVSLMQSILPRPAADAGRLVREAQDAGWTTP